MTETAKSEDSVNEVREDSYCVVTSMLKKRLVVTMRLNGYLAKVSRYEDDGALFIAIAGIVAPAKNFCDDLTPEMEASLGEWSLLVSNDMAAEEQCAPAIAYLKGEDSPIGMSAFIVSRPIPIGIKMNILSDIESIGEIIELLRAYAEEGKPIAFMFDAEDRVDFDERAEKLLKRIVKVLPEYMVAKQGTKTFLYYGMSLTSDEKEEEENFTDF